MGFGRDSDHLSVIETEPERSLEELLLTVRSRLCSSLNHVGLLTAAAPFCSPVLELARDDLREALACLREAEELERYTVRLLAGPFPRGTSIGGEAE